LPKIKRVNGNVPVYSSAGHTGWHNKPLVDKRGIIVGRKGTIGSIYKSEKPFFAIDTVYYISENDTYCNLDFLFYMLSDLDLNNLNSDSAVPGLNRNTAYDQDIILPPLPEQKAIAEVLFSLDDKIDLLHRQNKTLEDMAQVLFCKWFIEEAKEDWEVGKLGDLLTLKSGFAFKSKDFVDYSNHKIIKIKNIKGNGIIDITDTTFIDEEISQLEKVKFYKLEIGDIILAMSGNTTGKIGVICCDENLYLNQRVRKFFIEDKIYRNFVYLFLMSGSYEEKILNMGYGSAQPNVSPSQIHNIELSIPPRKTVELFAYQAQPFFEKIFLNQSQIRTLENLRDILLPKLLSGAVRVRGINK